MKRPPNPSYIPHIDGLRGLAVLLVLLFHLDIAVFKGGFVGVDVFFVISGFLITDMIVKEIETTGKFSFANFYARRIKRIFPAFFVMLVFATLGAILFLGAKDYAAFFKALRFASASFSNVFFSRDVDYFATDNTHSALLHTWSLGVEEQFYIGLPLLLILTHKFLGIQRAGIILGVLLLFSFAISEYLLHTDAKQAFYLIQSRAWELALGGIVALKSIPPLTTKKSVELCGVAGILAIVAAAMLFDESDFPGIKAILPCLGAALFLYAGKSSPATVHKWMSHTSIVFVGLISYSLYLFHFPIISIYKSYFGDDLNAQMQISMALASFLLAYLSYRFVEQPIRHAKIHPVKVIICGLLVIAVFIAGSNALKRSSKAAWRVNYAMDEMEVLPNEYYKTCADEGSAFDKKNCIIGDHKESYEVILVGDSHAAHYIPTVLAWAKDKNLTVRLFMRGDCPTWIRSNRIKKKAGKIDTYCMELTQKFYETLESDQNIQYVFLGFWLAKGTEDVRHSLETIKSHNNKIYYLGDVPEFKQDPHECRIKNNLFVARYFPREQSDCLAIDWDRTNSKIAQSHPSLLPLLKEFDIPYFDPIPFIQTPFDAQGHFLFMDDNHLNRYGARFLVPPFTAFMEGQQK